MERTPLDRSCPLLLNRSGQKEAILHSVSYLLNPELSVYKAKKPPKFRASRALINSRRSLGAGKLSATLLFRGNPATKKHMSDPVKLARFEIPNRLVKDEDTSTDTYAKFTAEPFEAGYGHTIGNSLRRVLLSSLEGAAITSVRITGAQHEFTSLPGVKEDVTEIILNLKQIRFKHFENKEPATLSINVSVWKSSISWSDSTTRSAPMRSVSRSIRLWPSTISNNLAMAASPWRNDFNRMPI